MIPYAILAGQVYFSTCKLPLDIRILELSPSYFSFRLSKKISVDRRNIEKICLFFYQYDEQSYQKLQLRNFHITLQETAAFYNVFQVTVLGEDQLIYGKAAGQLTREYLTYIERKDCLTDQEVASLMTAYPEEEEASFALEEKQQIRQWCHEIAEKTGEKRQSALEYHILLDTPDKLEKYLRLGMQEYVTAYWSELGLQDHVCARGNYSGIHVGNAFCPHLLPKWPVLKKVLEKAKKENLQVTYLLPPLSQSLYEKMQEMMAVLHAWLLQGGQQIEIEVGDLGIYRSLSGEKWTQFHISQGILCHKHSKDSRSRYLQMEEKKEDLQPLDYSDRALYLPLYQMNTATFCTVQAMEKHGQRGAGERILHCERECLRKNFRYPKHLRMIGRYNSLFGMNEDSMVHQEMLEKMIEEKKYRWVVINL